jgi:hypothetical protein
MYSYQEEADYFESGAGEAEAQTEADFYEHEILPLAKYLHENYEELSKKTGWETQKNCRVDFEYLPEQNRKVMEGLAYKLISEYFKPKA